MDQPKVGGGVKVVATMLVVGGLAGIGIVIYMAYTFLQQHWIYIVLVAGFGWLFVWSAITGVRLWRNDPRGWKWAMILFAAQIPVLKVPGFSYEFYTAASISLMGGHVEQTLPIALGSNIELYLDTRITDLVYGANLLAVAVLVYLFRKRTNPAVHTDGAR